MREIPRKIADRKIRLNAMHNKMAELRESLKAYVENAQWWMPEESTKEWETLFSQSEVQDG